MISWQKGSIRRYTDEELIFEDVDPNFRFIVFTYVKEEGDSIIKYCYCNKLSEIDRKYAQYEKNPLKFYRGLTGELCILQWIRSKIEFQILEKILKFPTLNDKDTKLKLKTARELDTTLDIDKYTDKPTSIPLLGSSGKLKPKESVDMFQRWKPENPSTYNVEIFVWESVDEPDALSPPISTTIIVK